MYTTRPSIRFASFAAAVLMTTFILSAVSAGFSGAMVASVHAPAVVQLERIEVIAPHTVQTAATLPERARRRL